MRELKAVVNALFVFAVFLLLQGFFDPRFTRSEEGRPPRFLRMEVEQRNDGFKVRHRYHVPYRFIRGSLRLVSGGAFTRELREHFDCSVEHDELKSIWMELAEKEPGTDVQRDHDGSRFTFRKSPGGIVELVVTEGTDEDRRERVTLRLPETLLASAVDADRDLDVDTILAELEHAGRGGLLEVESRDAHVRIWME